MGRKGRPGQPIGVSYEKAVNYRDRMDRNVIEAAMERDFVKRAEFAAVIEYVAKLEDVLAQLGSADEEPSKENKRKKSS